MTNWNRTTAENVAAIEAGIRERGYEPESTERWEGDGVWQVWIKHGTEGASSRSAHVGGNDTGMDPGADLSDGMGGEEAKINATPAETVDWLTGRPAEEILAA